MGENQHAPPRSQNRGIDGTHEMAEHTSAYPYEDYAKRRKHRRKETT